MPNNQISWRNFCEIFYRFLNTNTKVIVDTITCGVFISLHLEQAAEILNWVSKVNWGWHSKEKERGSGTYDISSFSKQRALDNIVAQEVAWLRTGIGLLTKKFVTMNGEKMKIVGTWGKSVKHDESISKEKSKYLDKEMVCIWSKAKGLIRVLRTRGKEIKVWTFRGRSIGIWAMRGMVTRGERMIISGGVEYMFHQRTMMLILGWKHCLISW